MKKMRPNVADIKFTKITLDFFVILLLSSRLLDAVEIEENLN